METGDVFLRRQESKAVRRSDDPGLQRSREHDVTMAGRLYDNHSRTGMTGVFKGVFGKLRGLPSPVAPAESLDRLRPLSPEARARIPNVDLIQARFDRADCPEARSLLLILSTERSGSTLLCEQLAALDHCYAHEYFQASQYLQILTERWSCLDGDYVAWDRFAKALRAHRTAPSGVLGINLHGRHLPHFRRAAAHFADLPTQYLHVVRRDSIGQALSFHEARQTGQWSAHFPKGEEDAGYDYEGVRNALAYLQYQNSRIEAFVRAAGAEARTVVYEELVADPAGVLSDITGMASDQVAERLGAQRETSVRRQSDPTERREQARRFAEDFLSERRSTF